MNGISSGFGAWNPIAWTLLFAGIFAVAALVRSLGRADAKRGSEQSKVFLSGNDEPSDAAGLHVRGDHLYWGLVEGLAGYYRRVQAMHTGVITDYVAWFVGVLGLVFVILVLVR